MCVYLVRHSRFISAICLTVCWLLAPIDLQSDKTSETHTHTTKVDLQWGRLSKRVTEIQITRARAKRRENKWSSKAKYPLVRFNIWHTININIIYRERNIVKVWWSEKKNGMMPFFSWLPLFRCQPLPMCFCLVAVLPVLPAVSRCDYAFHANSITILHWRTKTRKHAQARTLSTDLFHCASNHIRLLFLFSIQLFN